MRGLSASIPWIEALNRTRAAAEKRGIGGQAPMARSRARAPDRQDSVILFLDFDGVLHPDPCYERQRLFEQAPRLSGALAPFPEVRVVLSTTWRNLVEPEELLGYLPDGLRDRVVGATPNFGTFDARSALVPYRRQAECEQWLLANGHPADAWIAIDDRPSWFVPYCEQLIDCHPAIGFDAPAAGRLTRALLRARPRRQAAAAAASPASARSPQASAA